MTDEEYKNHSIIIETVMSDYSTPLRTEKWLDNLNISYSWRGSISECMDSTDKLRIGFKIKLGFINLSDAFWFWAVWG